MRQLTTVNKLCSPADEKAKKFRRPPFQEDRSASEGQLAATKVELEIVEHNAHRELFYHVLRLYVASGYD